MPVNSRFVLRLFRDGRRQPSLKRLSSWRGAGGPTGFRSRVRAAAAAILAFGTGLLVWAPHAAQAADEVNYVVLGDSYSTGVGAGDYDTNEASCKRSSNAYSQLWVKEFSTKPVADFTFVACSGATTADVESQQLGSLGPDTTMVTMTIGGNDIGFTPTITECLLTATAGDESCIASARAAGVQAAESMPAKLDALYKKIKEKAPNSQVFVMGYPHIFELGDCSTSSLSGASREAINDATSALNNVTREAATANGFHFVDGERAFGGRGVCTTADGGAWLTDSSAGTDLFHPNRDGQEAYAKALDGVVQGVGPVAGARGGS